MKPANYRSIIIITTGLLLSNCKSGTITGEATEKNTTELNIVELTPTQAKTSGVITKKPEKRNLREMLHVNGVVDVPPQNLVTVSCPMGGFVLSTDLLQGMKVRRGQIIAVLQNPQFIEIQQEYISTRHRLVYAEQEYKRQEELSQQNVAAQKIFQQTTAEYNALKGACAALREKMLLAGLNPQEVENGNIKSTVQIVSPVSGYVTEVNMNIGKYIQPHEALCEIVNTEHLHVELNVFEKDISRIRVGQKLTFTLSTEDRKERTATIYLINKKISSERTVRVHAHMDKEDSELMPGTFIKAQVEVERNNTWAVPDESIVSDGQYNWLFIRMNKGKKYLETDSLLRFKMVPIQKGKSSDGYTEIICAENPEIANEEIVTNGAYYLYSKLTNVEHDE
ncbi:MAG: efflux RND transporter periplasmic adaptor subunit [Cytophagaceae bacterium]|nr:efflux RND transporter periplasmic adaptor subunit [Cytophagaceae bacterium]MDW8455929.1 efflux RND transporter periplasmic adaptor subunit [Cytophagaceae bacterium]